MKLADKLKDTKCTGVYSAGVLITKNAVSDYVPLMRSGAEGQLTTQFDAATCAQLGLLKQDLLGLDVLDVIARAEKMIRARHNPKFDIHHITLDDPKTYEMLTAGQNFALFQFSGKEINNLVKQLKPNKLSDLAALLALYRPGPLGIGLTETFVCRKNGQEKFSYQTPLLEKILKETYGCIIYQEQLMQIAQQLGGFSPAESDTLRKMIGKHNVKAVAEFEEKFVAGCKKNHIPKEAALSIYEQMRKYGVYGFNKSHAYSYALVAYQVAYLKANYPLEFLSASLASELQHTDEADSAETILSYLTEALKISH